MNLCWRGAAALVVLAVAFIAGCAPGQPPRESTEATVAPSAPTAPPAGFPDADYRQAQAAGHRVLRVDSERSLVVVEVRRAGALARLGHDHVVASHDVQGYVDLDGGRADLYLPLLRLAVDEPDLRSGAGFDSQPSAAAIAGTRHNMLGKVLDAERFPFVVVAIRRSAVDATALQVAVTLHDTTRSFAVPAQIETLADGVAVAGRFSVNQTDFGIVPLSVLNGALQVADRLDLRFHVVARRG